MFLSSNRKKTPIVLQMEATECGAACLSMILAYYGRYVPLDILRDECGVNRNGCKASVVVKTARRYGMESSGVRVLTDDLVKMDGPMIIYWEFNHFVVYEGCSKNHKFFYLNDPAMGPRTVSREVFENSYTGVALTFKPTEKFEKLGKPVNLLEAVKPLLRKTSGVLLTTIWSSLLLVIPGLIVPCLTKVFVDNIIPSERDWMLPVLCLFVLMILIQVVLQWILDQSLRRGKVQLSVNKTLGMLRHLLGMPIIFFTQRSAADIQSRLSLNASVARHTFSSVVDNSVKLAISLFFLCLMFVFSPLLSVVILFFFGIDILCILILTRMRSILNQSLYMTRTKLMNSIVNGIEIFENLKSSGKELTLFKQWTDKLAQFNSQKLKFNTMTEYFSVIPFFFGMLNNVVTLCLGSWLIMNGDLTLGGMFAFQTIIASFTSPFMSIIKSSADLVTLKANITNVNDIFQYHFKPYFKNEDLFRTEMVKPYASIEFKNVDFGYNLAEEPFIKNFSLSVPAGKRIAIVGLSGSGKSTLVKLASGIYQPSAGEILLNGIPYSEYSLKEFYATVGVIDQNVTLFSGTIKDNLSLFSENVKQENLIQAIKDAQLFDELHDRGAIMNQKVQEGGSNYSGGQCQRMEISRVFAKNTPLLILDEATSALDTITEKKIDRVLRKKGVTQIIIAHRLSTIRDADEIIVMDNGCIVERGRHEDLIALNGLYSKLMRADHEERQVAAENE